MIEVAQLTLPEEQPAWLPGLLALIQSRPDLYARSEIVYYYDLDGGQWSVENPWYKEGR